MRKVTYGLSSPRSPRVRFDLDKRHSNSQGHKIEIPNKFQAKPIAQGKSSAGQLSLNIAHLLNFEKIQNLHFEA